MLYYGKQNVWLGEFVLKTLRAGTVSHKTLPLVETENSSVPVLLIWSVVAVRK